ncbi:MAG: CPBP family intramembrane metalloprotease [Chloroflexi bacterium]|nr:CPBP family intramembrane metalloprotease [Chloroflexota bacterium]
MHDHDVRFPWSVAGELAGFALVWGAVLTIGLQFSVALGGRAGAPAGAWLLLLATIAFDLGMLAATAWCAVRRLGHAALGMRGCARRWYGAAVLLAPACMLLGASVRWPGVVSAHDGLGSGVLPPWQLAALIALAVVIGPTTEELVFRGVLQPLLHQRWGVVGVIASALAFMLVHGPALGGAGVVALGSAASWLRLRSGAVMPGLLMHALYNLGVLLVVLLPG